jgi:adenylate kinase
MRHQTQQRAVIIYGPPGSGKGTQAELLARLFGFVHFDIGHYIESLVHAPGASKDPILRRERANYDAGRLCTASWVLAIAAEAITRIAKFGGSVVLSGSARTISEALGSAYAEKRTRKPGGLIAILERLYGKRNVRIVVLKVRPASSLKRNRSRSVCSVCGLPVLGNARAKQCSFCEGPLHTRADDHPSIIKGRLKVYRDSTMPIIRELRKLSFHLHEVNGEPAPYKVHEAVKRAVGLSR